MEEIILSHLAHSEKYARKVLPHLKADHFTQAEEKLVFTLIKDYMEKYNALPTHEVLYIELGGLDNITQTLFDDAKDVIKDLKADDSTKTEWLIDQTEKFVQERSIHDALRNAIGILDTEEGGLTKEAIPGLLQDALSVAFSTDIGHDFIEDAADRYESYHQQEKRVRFNLDRFNRITGGGLPTKTLNCIMASTGVGKSMAMCSMAAANLMDQENVLYITLEMSEERIAQRIDANLLDVPLGDLSKISKEDYNKKVEALRSRVKGRLIVKEYPTATAGAHHFRALLDELRIKKNFVPDIIYIDYINLCISSRIKMGAGTNSYGYIKAIAEEIRGLAVEYGPPIMTATQANRGAMNSSDMDLTNTSDSIGLPMTVDFMVSLITTPELEEDSRLLVKQLKNRYGDPGYYRKFTVGVDKSRMRLYDVVEDDDVLDAPVMDNSDFGERLLNERRTFDGFN